MSSCSGHHGNIQLEEEKKVEEGKEEEEEEGETEIAKW